MRLVIMGFCLIALSGCDKPEIKQCEEYIIAKLRAPSTDKRIEASGIRSPWDKPQRYMVQIEYDAANAYGTPIRSVQFCAFSLKGLGPDTSKYYDFDNDPQGKGLTREELRARTDAIIADAEAVSTEADRLVDAAADRLDAAADRALNKTAK